MNYYDEIKNELLNNEINKKVKNYLINKSDLKSNYNVGKLLREAGSKYGEGIIKDYSRRLTNELGKGYTQSRLRYYRRFYDVFEKCPTLSDALSYSHYCEIIWLDIAEIKYYVEIGKKYNERNLRYMRQFYEMIEEIKWNTMRSKLSWTFFSEVLSVKDEDEILYYLNECINKTLTTRQLHDMN